MMLQFSQVSTVLRVSTDNFSALTSGASLVAISRSFIREEQKFVLTQSDFTADFQECLISYWAICQSSKAIAGHYNREYLSQITHIPSEEVQNLLDENANFLLFLRVYKIPIETEQFLKFNRQFAALASPIAVVSEVPVLSEISFNFRKNQIEKCTPPEHPDLELLQRTISHYAQTSPDAKAFDYDIRAFLGWTDVQPTNNTNQAYDWIQTIASSGKSSDGYLFEKRVRQSFLQLGFTNSLNNIKASLDPNATGGSGGIDIYCEKPFAIVGECKASKYDSVSNGVCAQLINLGTTHLGKDKFESFDQNHLYQWKPHPRPC